MTENVMKLNDDKEYVREFSDWECYMFGNNPEINAGFIYAPIKGHEPNRFVRWMMKVCFDCTWVKKEKE